MSLGDLLPTALQIGATILNTGALIAKGKATQLVAARRRAQSDFEAQQLDQAGVESRGVGMIGAADQTMRSQLVISDALAKAAASGAGASDPTVMSIIARTAGEGAYRAQMAMYEGEAQARLDTLRAAGLRFQGDTAVADASVARRADNTAALATALTGGVKAMSMYEKYWAGQRGPGGQAISGGGGYTYDGGD